MNQKVLQIVAAIPGLLMLNNAIGFIANPEGAAASLGMPLLEGMALSTQIGDLGAFFLCSASFIFYGAYKSNPTLLSAAASMLGFAAIMRLVAWGFHGADLATVFITVEVVITVWLVVCAYLLAPKSLGSETE
ncbi:hypothetical protein OAD96_01390 [Pseudomonadales bacterium]|nr:hypothetical protein [Pseudomonadales bacterium]MDB9879606.1 hypothetical protein [Pseudomonadales bacterium]MDB9942609.1 hypothetical protein [Pseudomonadales bacterium]MDC0013641.1 hypothetical protein [Pseudomonadales bacterium]MDC1307430.1 hypothetical protein [Pseudomonadales bacterium]